MLGNVRGVAKRMCGWSDTPLFSKLSEISGKTGIIRKYFGHSSFLSESVALLFVIHSANFEQAYLENIQKQIEKQDNMHFHNG